MPTEIKSMHAACSWCPIVSQTPWKASPWKFNIYFIVLWRDINRKNVAFNMVCLNNRINPIALLTSHSTCTLLRRIHLRVICSYLWKVRFCQSSNSNCWLTRNAWQSLAYSPPGIAVLPPVSSSETQTCCSLADVDELFRVLLMNVCCTQLSWIICRSTG